MIKKQNPYVNKIRHTSYASLAAIGCKLREIDLLAPIKTWVKINQKTVKRSPFEKIQDVLITILAGANGVVEINEILRVDETLQRAFGRKECAEQSVVQLTLNKCTPQNVGEMMKAMDEIFRKHSSTCQHDFQAKPLMLDIDMTGLPCGKKAEEALKGYQANLGIRYGRQMCRVSSADYEEVVVDRIYPGNVHFSLVIPWMVDDVTETLRLGDENRKRTVIRMDAGGGAQIDLILSKGYQIHSKEYSSKRAEGFAMAVKHWVPDPNHPRRELGWFPIDLKDFCRPVKRMIMRWRTDTRGQMKYASLISTLEPEEVMQLLKLPTDLSLSDDEITLAYSKLYDMRAGTIEKTFKESKRGLGINKRSKKRFAAQQMIILLGQLAQNIIVWSNKWLMAASPSFPKLGTLRTRRKLFRIAGFLEFGHKGKIIRIVLNKKAGLHVRLALAVLLRPLNIEVTCARI